MNKASRTRRADEVRTKLEKLGVSESDVADAVEWARLRSTPSNPHSNRKKKEQ